MPNELSNELADVILTVPLAPETGGYEPHLVSKVKLSVKASKALKRLYEAVSGFSSDLPPLKLGDGSFIKDYNDTVSWLIERIADSVALKDAELAKIAEDEDLEASSADLSESLSEEVDISEEKSNKKRRKQL